MQTLFDLTSFLLPVLLQGKVILRKTWEAECKDLNWDKLLPRDVTEEIIQFFISLFELEDVKFPRSLWPRSKTVGDPELVVFSDVSIKAFGAMVYIRWKLETRGWWSTLMMSKSKLGPKNRVSIPCMELDGAVLAKRLREFVLLTLNLRFVNIFHLVDWSTVLSYLHKEDAKFKPYK